MALRLSPKPKAATRAYALVLGVRGIPDAGVVGVSLRVRVVAVSLA